MFINKTITNQEINRRNKRCKSCTYVVRVDGCYCCDYLAIEMKRRGCPGGDKCTKYKRRLVRRKKESFLEKKVIRDDGVVYQSVREASKENGVHESNVSAVCRGTRKRSAGHSFRFLDRNEV